MNRKPMARGAPMKRVPFVRKAPAVAAQVERVKPVAQPLARTVRYAEPANEPLFSAPKREYVRSSALLAAVQVLPCQHCGRAEPGTVCAAHSNWADWGGKGAHVKADDNCIAALCDRCHVPVLDQGSKLSRVERRAMWLAAHRKTVAALILLSLWPPGVPVPELHHV